MLPVPLHPGLAQRLLVVVARAHLAHEGPQDWDDLAAAAGVTASPRVLNRALSHLAEAGLIEGLRSPVGWFAVRPTARGVRRAGRAARRPLKSTATEAAAMSEPAPAPRPALRERVVTARAESAAELRLIDGLVRRGVARMRTTFSPRLLAMRATMLQAWHTFTTFP